MPGWVTAYLPSRTGEARSLRVIAGQDQKTKDHTEQPRTVGRRDGETGELKEKERERERNS